MYRPRISLAVMLLPLVLCLFPSCDTVEPSPPAVVSCTPSLTLSDVETIIAHAVEQAQRLNQRVIIAVSDREGNILGVFRMTGARFASASLTVNGTPVQVTTVDTCIRKARTAAFLSSNQHAFSTTTACFITRSHFPPGIANTPAGPLFGVGLSSLPGSDIMPNGSALSDQPGGIPIYKGGCLAGGIGVIGAASQFDPTTCTGQSLDEVIALGAVLDYAVPDDRRGDRIFIDGIRFLYTTSEAPAGNYTLTFANALAFGSVDSEYPLRASPARRFPDEGEVLLGGGFDFPIRAGTLLSAAEVRTIIAQAAAQAAKTRAAIRRPVGVAAQVFIGVVDVDGSVLGVWRTPDATIFSFDVCVQKARTALVFSNPNNPIAQNNTEFSHRLRSILGLQVTAPLAVTTRAVGFLAQEFFPPGIDRDSLGNRVEAGPLFEGTNFAYQFRLLAQGLPTFGANRGNGVTIFPGGIPLYKNGQLAGAIGISGDGVDQDDLIAAAGARGFEPPPNIRCDQVFYKGVRLPYIKLPRQPEVR
ncbi:MAG TPA: heme-binding protein [Bacteroidota bacterium]|nr:heme-binding protein [Bacteroidota bacterium]